MAIVRFWAHDTGALGELASQIKARGDPESELQHLLIGKLAYFRAQARGCPAGPELTDWLQAESEVLGLNRRVRSNVKRDRN
jgi:hypothetical protein